MDDEQPIEEQAPKAPADVAPPADERYDGSGPGFLRGLIFGAIAGAVLGLLLAPRLGEEQPAEPEGLVGQLRARVREATSEAQQAARDAEHAKRARFEELMREGQ
jgi:gas vesicle protein